MLETIERNATPAAAAQHPRLMDRVRAALRVAHYALSTERNYCHWIRRFILFHNKRHPSEMGAPEKTTMIYTHVLNRGGRGTVSPLDRISA